YRDVGVHTLEEVEGYFTGVGPYGVEPYSHVSARLIDAVRETQTLGLQRVVFVTHQALIRCLAATTLKVSPGPWVGRIPADNCSLTLIQANQDELKLKTLNWTPRRMILEA
ncbi:MAG: histidine phosphatase family protein, partial [Thermoprotei archaeon]